MSTGWTAGLVIHAFRSLSLLFSDTLSEMLGELFLPCDTPEAPKQSFFKNLFGPSPNTLDREELCKSRMPRPCPKIPKSDLRLFFLECSWRGRKWQGLQNDRQIHGWHGQRPGARGWRMLGNRQSQNGPSFAIRCSRALRLTTSRLLLSGCLGTWGETRRTRGENRADATGRRALRELRSSADGQIPRQEMVPVLRSPRVDGSFSLFQTSVGWQSHVTTEKRPTTEPL